MRAARDSLCGAMAISSGAGFAGMLSRSPTIDASMSNDHDTINYRPLLKRYARYAPRYDRRFARYSAATLNKALEIIPSNGERSLLDVACGTGILVQLLHERRPQLRITGVDITPQMLEQARRR